jgi:hypothetical protein
MLSRWILSIDPVAVCIVVVSVVRQGMARGAVELKGVIVAVGRLEIGKVVTGRSLQHRRRFGRTVRFDLVHIRIEHAVARDPGP